MRALIVFNIFFITKSVIKVSHYDKKYRMFPLSGSMKFKLNVPIFFL